jgi:hypothetical protein
VPSPPPLSCSQTTHPQAPSPKSPPKQPHHTHSEPVPNSTYPKPVLPALPSLRHLFYLITKPLKQSIRPSNPWLPHITSPPPCIHHIHTMPNPICNPQTKSQTTQPAAINPRPRRR